METSQIVLAILGVIAAGGAAVGYFARNRGAETIRLLQTNIQSYKDEASLKNARITALEVQLQVKDDTIKELLKNAQTK